MTQMMAGALMTNFVRMENADTKPFSMKYGPRDRLVLAPGQVIIVQEEVAWQFTGRWWTDNSDPRMKARAEEVKRLRTLFGAYDDDAMWEKNRPHLIITAPDGSRITTVVDDPEGAANVDSTAFAKQMSTESQLAILQQQVLELTARLGATYTDAPAATDTGADTPTAQDLPPTQPSPSSPYNPAHPQGPRTVEFGGQSVPVAPPPVTFPPSDVASPPGDDPELAALGVSGARLPVTPAVAYDPNADTPISTDHGPANLDAPISAPVDTPKRVPAGKRSG